MLIADDNKENEIKPWDEERGLYGIMVSDSCSTGNL